MTLALESGKLSFSRICRLFRPGQQIPLPTGWASKPVWRRKIVLPL